MIPLCIQGGQDDPGAFMIFLLCRFLFMDMKFLDAGTNEGRDMSLSPHAAPALSDEDVTPVREVSHRGSHSSGGETPFQRLADN
jgi:hypothetical protein